MPGQGWDQAPQTWAARSAGPPHWPGRHAQSVRHLQPPALAIRQPDANPEYASTGRPVALLNDNAYLNTTYRSPLRARLEPEHRPGPHPRRQPNPPRPAVQCATSTSPPWPASCSPTTRPAPGSTSNSAPRPTPSATASSTAPRPKPPAATWAWTSSAPPPFSKANWCPRRRLAARAGLRAEYSALLHHYSLPPAWPWPTRPAPPASSRPPGAASTKPPPTTCSASATPSTSSGPSTYCSPTSASRSDRTLRAEIYRKNYRSSSPSTPRTLQPRRLPNAGAATPRASTAVLARPHHLQKVDYWVSYGLLDTRRQFRADPTAAVPTFAAAHNPRV